MSFQEYPTVKSAGRFFEILELFDITRESLTSAQVQRQLGYPQSSTQTLLKSMVSRGFLSFDRLTMTYFPTIRVSRLGSWLTGSDQSESAEGPSWLRDISFAIGMPCELWWRDDLSMIRADGGCQPEPLFASTVGLAVLADYTPATISLLRGRAEVVSKDFDARLSVARTAGHAIAALHDGWIVAQALPARLGLPGSSAILVHCNRCPAADVLADIAAQIEAIGAPGRRHGRGAPD